MAGPLVHHLAVRSAAHASFGRSECEHCGLPKPLLVRRCPACSAEGRQREPWVWAVTGVAFGLTAWLLGPNWLLPAHLWFVAVTLILTITDFDEKLIPNRVLYPGTLVALGLLTAGASAEDRLPGVVRGIAAAAIYFGILLLVALIARGGFGMGDVKLAVLVGLFSGFWSWATFAVSIFFTGMLGGVVAIALLISGRAKRGDSIPYGPVMVAGAWLAVGLGDSVLWLI